MEKYGNYGGDSGVLEFENGDEYIKVKFNNNSIYLYSYKKPGSSHVEKMKILAKNGRGLNSYINTYVKFQYEIKLM
jgi:hypothetical protein